MGLLAASCICIASAAYVIWRLWWSVSHQTIKIKGQVFERAGQPGYFWLYLSTNIIGALILTLVAALMTFAFIEKLSGGF